MNPVREERTVVIRFKSTEAWFDISDPLMESCNTLVGIAIMCSQDPPRRKIWLDGLENNGTPVGIPRLKCRRVNISDYTMKLGKIDFS